MLRFSRLIALASAALASAAFPAAAELRQFGNVVYELRPGWTVGPVRDGVQHLLLDPSRARCQSCQLLLGPALPGFGDPVAAVEREGLRLLDPEAAARAREYLPARYVEDRKDRALGLIAQKSGDWLYIVNAVLLADRIQFFAIKGEADDPDSTDDVFDAYFAHFVPLLDTLTFVSDGAAPLLPEARPGPLSGLWWGLTTDYAFRIDGTIGLDVRYRTLLFWPDGHFYDGTPPEGLRPLDRDGLIAATDTAFGVYTLGDDTLALTFANGETETLRRSGKGWRDGRRDLVPADPLPDGTPLSGTISDRYSVSMGGSTGLVGAVTSQWSTTFHPDGTYESVSDSGGFGESTDGSGNRSDGIATGAEGANGGRYEVRDGLLIRYPADGSAPVRSLAYHAGGTIMIGDDHLKP